VGDAALGAEGVRAEDALPVVVAGDDLLLAGDGFGKDCIRVHRRLLPGEREIRC
jgi:hypothetical protein